MNEAETRAELIDPALKAAGWGSVGDARVRREVIAPGRIKSGGRRENGEVADYVLTYRNTKLAVIEAKRRNAAVTEGLGQAKTYAAKLQVRFALSTNGDGIYQADMSNAKEGNIDAFPSPDELWAATFGNPDLWRDRFAAIPFEDSGAKWEPRYYQEIAIRKTLDAICAGRNRILLTLATGTGKTSIAFQLAWKLFTARWNLTDWTSTDEPTRRPRILFLADRNILANQAFSAFSAFDDDALIRIDPEEIARRGHVPKNGAVFFTIFQTFMTGRDAEGKPAPNFFDYPPDFFDFIVVDECHRGGANDESSWRDILEYFAPAVQLGLTATPKRQGNVDTYKYFGEPVFVYSLKEGINDGYLTPFKVRQIATTLDDYIYTTDDTVTHGIIDPEKRYRPDEFNRLIQIEARERYRVKIFLDGIDQREKAIIFCASQEHALLIRDLVNQLSTSRDPGYCVRVTADEGARGDAALKAFQNNDKTLPTILTTSQKLSTGVDARNVRHIVLMRPVKSMIEFKQIIGRGTRTYEGKDFFTIHDFEKAYEHFNDPAWDGEPAEPVAPAPRPRPGGDEDGAGDNEGESGGEDRPPRPEKIVITLADGKERTLQHMTATSYWGPNGPMSAAEFVQSLYGELPRLFKDEDELRTLWGEPGTRKQLLASLAERGFGDDELAIIKTMVQAENSDLYDVLAYIAFALAPITRAERVDARKELILANYDDKLQAFIDFVLAEYVKVGVEELDQAKLPELLTLKYRQVEDAKTQLGGLSRIVSAFVGFQKHLYGRGADG